MRTKFRSSGSATKAPISLALWLFVSITVAVSAVGSENYPGKLAIEKAKRLTPEQRTVEARFAAYLEANTEAAIARYLENFGNEINVDNARELSFDYAPGGIDATDPVTMAARTRWSEAVHEPASALIKELYRRVLAQKTPLNRRRQVLFTAGGAGVGKTTSLRKIGEFSQAVQLKLAEIVYDTTLASFGSAMGRIVQALESGRMISIVFVYRDPVISFIDGVLPRARETGRVVPMEVILDTHLGSLEAIVKIAAAFRNNPQVAVVIVDNESVNTNIADLAFVEARARKYGREELRTKLLEALEIAYQKGQKGDPNGISEALYRAIKSDTH